MQRLLRITKAVLHCVGICVIMLFLRVCKCSSLIASWTGIRERLPCVIGEVQLSDVHVVIVYPCVSDICVAYLGGIGWWLWGWRGISWVARLKGHGHIRVPICAQHLRYAFIGTPCGLDSVRDGFDKTQGINGRCGCTSRRQVLLNVFRVALA